MVVIVTVVTVGEDVIFTPENTGSELIGPFEKLIKGKKDTNIFAEFSSQCPETKLIIISVMKKLKGATGCKVRGQLTNKFFTELTLVRVSLTLPCINVILMIAKSIIWIRESVKYYFADFVRKGSPPPLPPEIVSRLKWALPKWGGGSQRLPGWFGALI